MVNRRTLAACSALVIPCAACFAQGTYTSDQYFDDRWYVTLFGTYVNSDNARFADDGWGGGLSFGKPISLNWNIELRTQYEQLDATSGGAGEYKNWSTSFDAQWFFMGRQGLRMWQSGSVQPYLVGGMGAINDKISAPAGSVNKTNFMANLGGGLVWPLSSARLVADARYRYDANSSRIAGGGHFNDWLFTIGLQIPFGPAPRVAQAAMPPPPPPPPPPTPPPAPTTRTVNIVTDGTFAFDSAELTADGRNRINAALQQYKSAGFRPHSILIVGYTDPLAGNEYNLRLSLARANAVRDQMVSQGVRAGVIQTEGRGEADLRVTEADCKAQGKAKTHNELIACLAPNRRVEVRATGEQVQ